MQADRVQQQIEKTQGMLAATGPILKGSVSEVVLGKKTRSRGNRIVYLLTYKGEGNRTKSLYIRKAQVAEVQTMIRNYRKFKTALKKLLELNVTLFKARRMISRFDTP